MNPAIVIEKGQISLSGERMIAENSVRGRVLTDAEFDGLFKNYEKSAWRLELLPSYLPSSDPTLKAFLEGQIVPPRENSEWWKHKEEWRSLISDSIKAGKSMGRVHILPERLTPYLRYEVEWGYVYNSLAGDDIRLLESENVTDYISKNAIHDFWLFDEKTVVICDYTKEGDWVGARLLDSPAEVEGFLEIRDAVLSNSIDFPTFLRRYRNGKYG